MSDCFDHMCEAMDGRWDDSYRDDSYRYEPYGRSVKITRCKYCRKEISFLGRVPWDKDRNKRHECDFSQLLDAQ